MSKTKLFTLIAVLISTLILISFLIPKETRLSPETRIILEHTYHTYIAPGCYQHSNPTNYIQDSTRRSTKLKI